MIGVVSSGLLKRCLVLAAAAALCTSGLAREQATSGNSPMRTIRFTDVTERSGVRASWIDGGSGHDFYVEQMGGGAAFLDYDGDGWLDLFITGGGVLPGYKGASVAGSRLYRNNRDGTFADETRASGLQSALYSLGVATADYDNDGHADLYVTTAQKNILYRNDGRGHFVDVTDAARVSVKPLSASPTFLDYDADGWPDLFVARYMDYSIAADKGCLMRGMYQQDINKAQIAAGSRGAKTLNLNCGPHDMPVTSSRLFHNNGNGTFTDVSDRSGISKSKGHPLAMAVSDFNEDGRTDIFVASDGYPNMLFMNQGNGIFKDGAGRAGVAVWRNGEALAGMGTDAADYNGDGHDDLIVTNFEWEPVTLFRGRGDGSFIDMSEASGLVKPTWPFLKWGARLLDFNGDGYRDLLVVNGHVDPRGTPGRPLNMPDDKWHGKGFAQEAIVLAGSADGTFVDVSSSAGPFFRTKHPSRGAAFGDFDNDGDWDIVTVNINDPAVLLRNDSAPTPWGRLELEGQNCNRDALGARVRLMTPGAVQKDHVRSGGSYLSDHDRRLLFSLPGGRPATAEIRWPCGAVQSVLLEVGKTTHAVETGCRLASRAKGSR